ncbi:MAG: trypsin-like peptidase domain-containing protein [Spirochaetota bacterium]|nr:MAG: trypsin-like peptidase domain-containing protein [Spirochaetota bacterium]
MKNRFFLYILVFSSAAYFLLSCSTSAVRDSEKVAKVDKKIISEFHENTENADFYAACGSYIEFLNCCDDERKTKLTYELKQLYETKMEEALDAGDTLTAIEYTYSLINIFKGNIPDTEWNTYYDTLKQYIERYVSSELSNKGKLEKASWLIYLTQFTAGNQFLYRELIEIFLERRNLLLVNKYFETYSALMNTEEESGHAEEVASLQARIEELETDIKVEDASNENTIENTIKSSVRIFVDKGIKTELGVGRPDQVLGTGVVIDERGYIITNYHIIESSVDPKYEGYSRVYVIPGKDESIRYVAKIVGYDSIFDLALLKIENSLPTFIQLGDSDTLQQGQQIVAIGNPVGLTNTVTSGIISSVDRPFFQIGNIIQIDAALNPGNSGGALIDGEGHLVGIAFAGLEDFQNLNFVIPSNLLLSILFKLYEGGEVKRSWMGGYVGEHQEEVQIDYIAPEAPANIYRFLKGDVIYQINEKPVSSVYSIQNEISLFRAPLIVRLKVKRDNEVTVKNVLIEERPVFPSIHIFRKDAQENVITPLFGLVVDKVDSPGQKSFIVKKIITSSIASSVGITEGDTIKIQQIRYDEEAKIFSMMIDLKSKRFGYMNKNIVLYSRAGVANFI